MQELIEQAFTSGGNKVDLISHSLGGPVTYYFLMHMAQTFCLLL